MTSPVDAGTLIEGKGEIPSQRWCIITPEYPPLPGGIGDHSFLLAQALTAAGDTVEVWIPPGPRAPELPGVTVHVLPSEYGLDALRVLRDALRALPADARVLVQYAPTAFGMRRLNLPFALLLFLHARSGRNIDLYFHGGGYPIRVRQAPGRTLGGMMHRIMTWLVVRDARRIFVAIPEWQRHLRRLGIRESDRDRVVTWVPVPSNVPDRADMERVREVRASLVGGPAGGGRPGGTMTTSIIGHFGRYGAFHQRIMPRVIERVLDARRSRTMLLVGFGSGAVRDAVSVARPDLAHRIVATGHVDAGEVSAHLAACDVLLQPYEEGASTSRASLIAGLALGCAVITNIGPDTGAVWTTRRSVWLTKSYDADDLARAVGTLLDDPPLRASLGAEGRALHDELFAMSRGITRVRNTALSPSVEDAASHEALPATAVHTSIASHPRAEGSPRVLMVHAAPFEVSQPMRGAAFAMHQLANTMTDLGAAVTVASVGAPPPDARYPYRALPRGGLRRLLAPLAVNFLPLGDFDVVHFHGGDWLTVRRPRPTVRTVYPDTALTSSWRTRLGDLFARLADRIATTRADAVIAASVTGVAVQRTIAGGVDVERFHPAERLATPRILFVGDLLGERRGRWLYDLFREHIAPRRPEVELHLIADVAPPSQPGMRFEALTPEVDLASAYAEARVLAAPSTLAHADAALLEAMAAGVPVVATPAPGAIELLGNGRFGVLADDAVFADAILRLLDDDATHARLAIAARARAEERSWERVADQYLTLYVSLMIGAADPVPSDGAPAAERHPRDLARALSELVAGANSMIDVGAGAGDATIAALLQDDMRRVLAVEPREEERRMIRRALGVNGLALDPRFELSTDPISAESGDDAATLDDHAAAMPSPLLVRVADAAALESILAGATMTLDRHETRWIVAIPEGARERYELTFRVKGYEVRHLRTRWPAAPEHWIVAARR